METVEYLVVCKDAQLLVVVSKAFMEGLLDGIEKYCSFFSEDILQTIQLLFTISKDTEPIAISQILFQRLLQEFEILMELRLWRYMESDSGIRHPCRTMAYLNTSESSHITGKGLSAYQLDFLFHLHTDGLLFHFSSCLQAFCQCLLRKTFLIGTVYSITYIQEVLGHQHRRFRKEREEGNLLRLHQTYFRYDFHLLALVFRQLRFNLKSTYGVDIITKQVDTEGELRTITIDVEDTASKGKLTWFIYVVNLMESQ